MPDRSHLTIGEVLSLLKEDFPDVSISKIRFLESQGLVDPERTPSGYRKFYEHDVERLRWILQQQREHFLPLKVIRGRLSEAERAGEVGGDGVGAGPAAPGAPPAPASRDAGVPGPSGAGAERRPPAASPPGAPGPAAEEAGGAGEGSGEPDVFTVEELAAAAGCAPSLVRDLQQYGLLVANATVVGTAYFDASALAVVRTGAAFATLGVEPRHLRAWRVAADREAALYEQLVMPLLRQRNPHARRQAAELLAQLSALGSDLRAALVGEAVRSIR